MKRLPNKHAIVLNCFLLFVSPLSNGSEVLDTIEKISFFNTMKNMGVCYINNYMTQAEYEQVTFRTASKFKLEFETMSEVLTYTNLWLKQHLETNELDPELWTKRWCDAEYKSLFG